MAKQSYESAASTKVRKTIDTIEQSIFLTPNFQSLESGDMFVQMRIASQNWVTSPLNCGF